MEVLLSLQSQWLGDSSTMGGWKMRKNKLPCVELGRGRSVSGGNKENFLR